MIKSCAHFISRFYKYAKQNLPVHLDRWTRSDLCPMASPIYGTADGCARHIVWSKLIIVVPENIPELPFRVFTKPMQNRCRKSIILRNNTLKWSVSYFLKAASREDLKIITVHFYLLNRCTYYTQKIKLLTVV